MSATRRHVLLLGGGGLATLALPLRTRAGTVEIIRMRGTQRGERVWFDPVGLAVAVGTTVRFVNQDPGNSHTSTAYHPDIDDRQRRIPQGAAPWDSEFLLPQEGFEVTLSAPGVYDYYCIPHELAGMVGRIIVGSPTDPGWQGVAPLGDDPDAETLAALPSVDEILASGRISIGDTK